MNWNGLADAGFQSMSCKPVKVLAHMMYSLFHAGAAETTEAAPSATATDENFMLSV